MKVESSRRAAS